MQSWAAYYASTTAIDSCPVAAPQGKATGLPYICGGWACFIAPREALSYCQIEGRCNNGKAKISAMYKHDVCSATS